MKDLGNALYEMLMALCEKNEAFFFHDHEYDGTLYRMFNYRLCSYTDFLEPAALECRGHMFRIDNSTASAHLVTLAPRKFFNLNENSMSMPDALPLGNVVSVTDKRDGSLISTYLHGNEVRLKSKGSLASDQAIGSMALIQTKKYADFKSDLYKACVMGLTVNMEYTAPDNRIVLSYTEPELRVFSIRNNIEGFTLAKEDIDALFPAISRAWVDIHKTPDDMLDFFESYKTEENKEGYVVQFETGTGVKLKTEWYFIRHRIKDTISNDKHLFEAIITDAVDDALSLFVDDHIVIDRIKTMTAKVVPKYNHMIDTIEKFYQTNQLLDRKSYAILSKDLPNGYLGLCMKLFDGKVPDYQTFAVKRCETFLDD